MYGIVNKAIEGLVTENFGQETWLKVKQQAEINISSFISNDPYDDSITYKLAIAASEILNIPLSDVLFLFGEYWILKTGLHHYGSLMQSGGNDLGQFLINLPNFHSRVMLMYPNITPPEFNVIELSKNKYELHYYSTRSGLTDFMHGLISGLGKMYNTKTEIELILSKTNGHDHDVFHIKY